MIESAKLLGARTEINQRIALGCSIMLPSGFGILGCSLALAFPRSPIERDTCLLQTRQVPREGVPNHLMRHGLRRVRFRRLGPFLIARCFAFPFASARKQSGESRPIGRTKGRYEGGEGVAVRFERWIRASESASRRGCRHKF
jgi:hypothetical protein